jgi:hypothetical protein
MKKATKYILGILLVGAITVTAVVLYVFNKPQRNISKEKPSYIMDPSMLVSDFSANEDSSTLKYNDKVIQVSGKIVEFSMENNGASAVFVNSVGGVSCTFDSLTSAKNYDILSRVKVGDSLTIKGRCDGFDMIMGVVLSKCVLVE